ncbi:MAG: lysozyme [Alphaproteobacteria bacterium]|nr:lysozyme [Alphaproteobacteria bacterium]
MLIEDRPETSPKIDGFLGAAAAATTLSIVLTATPTTTFSTVPIAPTTPTTETALTKKSTTPTKASTTYQVVNATAELIKHYEGSKPGKTSDTLGIYLDVAGNPTACYGRLLTPTQAQAYRQQHPDGIPKTLCAQWLKQDTITAMRTVLEQSNPTVPMKSGELAALTSLTYNIGEENLGKGLRKNLATGNYEAATSLLPQYNKAVIGGILQPVLGLTNRRQAEVHIATSGLPYYNGKALPPPEELRNSLEAVAEEINTKTAQLEGQIQRRQALQLKRDQDLLLTR